MKLFYFLCTYVCMCVHIWIYKYVSLHTFHVCKYVRMYIFVCVCCVCVCVYARTLMCACVVCVCACMHARWCVRVCLSGLIYYQTYLNAVVQQKYFFKIVTNFLVAKPANMHIMRAFQDPLSVLTKEQKINHFWIKEGDNRLPDKKDLDTSWRSAVACSARRRRSAISHVLMRLSVAVTCNVLPFSSKYFFFNLNARAIRAHRCLPTDHVCFPW